MKKTQALIAASLMSITGSAAALQYEWNLTQAPTTTTACGAVASCKMVFSSNGQDIAVYAYSTSLANTNSGIDPAGSLTAASLMQYSGGLGIKNASEVPVESGSPEHASDNLDRYDVLVFEALTSQPDKFDWTSLGIGWAQEFSVSGTGAVTVQQNTADMQFFAGGTASTVFTSLCLDGCAASTSIADGAQGFKSLGNVNNVASGSSVSIPGANAKGRYLVASGALDLGGGSHYFDAFKVNSVKGVPEPHMLGLLGIGLLAALGFARPRAVRS